MELKVEYKKVKFCDCGQLQHCKSEIERLKDLCGKLENELTIEMGKQMRLLVDNAALRITTAPESPQLISWQIIKDYVAGLEGRIAELESKQ